MSGDIVPILVGIALAILVGVFATGVGLDRDRAFYPVVTIVIALVTLFYQVQDPNFFRGVIWVIVWCVVGIIYFALIGRNKLILSPEEEFALAHRAK